MNPLGVLMDEMNKNGVSMEVKRQLKDGSLATTRPNEIATLNTKARIATTAQLLKNLNKEEKLIWAIQTKEEGNQLYKEQNFSAALDKYVEALSATDFESSENVDNLVIPVLCNLSACCIQLKEWKKAYLFSEQALKLRPLCRKAKYRQGISSMNMGEYDESITLLSELIAEHESSANESANGSSNNEHNETATENVSPTSMELNSNEIQKLPSLLEQARSRKRKQEFAIRKQKQALSKAFQTSTLQYTPDDAKRVTDGSDDKEEDGDEQAGDEEETETSPEQAKLKPLQPETTLEYIVVFIALVIKFLYMTFTRYLGNPSSSKARKRKEE
jgi:tetratricopeptide (TPR) repeat protein